ncbi:hypothetical protein Mal4_47080 [Maioricimonas rarisocia]|uniref:HicB-like antitoxin of toxin-antitoxin system domain-containing protein n=1 Tax=Maioricimonas rarisocia TaxID=2528026 RepID=A0A517ZD16_9PLAN|nr:hypothetical protein [Maioricimonas rarisocia]QDU40352.1 hypothetical protein Mal4_47080 [Maioricimonas rarisocia]
MAKNAKPPRIPLRVVFYYHEDQWVAHCLEFDLVGCGHSREEALSLLTDAIAVQVDVSIDENNPANLFRPADGRYFEMFARGKPTRVAHGEVTIGEIETREFSEDNGYALA